MSSSIDMKDKIVMITGGAQGIGLALAQHIVDTGGKVALVDVDEKLLSKAVDSLDGERALSFCGDVADQSFIEKTVESIVSKFGDLNGLINNAGIIRAAMASDMSLKQWNDVLNVNLSGAFICLQAVGKYFIQKAQDGVENPGSIVNVSSDAARKGTIGQINYGAAKSGVLGLTMCAAREWGKFNINVNSVCYGLVETSMTETIRQEKFRDKYLSQIPLRRFSSPQEVAPATCFLLSNAASYITGQHLSIDGGFYISS